MPSHGPVAKASPADWLIRGLLTVSACVGAYLSATYALAQTLAKSNVALAYRLAPYDGRIAAARAASLAGPRATVADRRRADALARAALKRDPTAVAAVSTLGLNAQLRGDTAGARRLFSFSQLLSRRDLQTQLWAIEDSVGRGDIRGALRHYDVALRTTPAAWGLLFPILASAAGEPPVRRELIRTLAGRPRWSESFVSYIATHGPKPASTIDLFAGLDRTGVAVPASASASLINALVAGGLTEEAWNYYAMIRRGADRRAARDPRFTADLAAPSALDWTPNNDGGLTASIEPRVQGGTVDFAAPASVGGPLLQQTQMLPPGEYRLDGHSAGIDQTEDARPYWTLKCADGRELGRVPLPNSSRSSGAFGGRLAVPAGCPVQVLVLIARPTDAIGGLSGQVDRVQLRPVR